METYNFWQDIFDTYQSLSIVMQLAWLVLPPLFLLSLVALVLRFWLRCRQFGPPTRGDLVYTVYRNDFGAFDVYKHDVADEGANGDADIVRVAGGDAGRGSERGGVWLG